MRRRHR